VHEDDGGAGSAGHVVESDAADIGDGVLESVRCGCLGRHMITSYLIS
jgi:hypothetical protein